MNEYYEDGSGTLQFYEELLSRSYLPGDRSPDSLCFGILNPGRKGQSKATDSGFICL